MGNGESEKRYSRAGSELRNRALAIPDSPFPIPVAHAARLSVSVKDSMLAAFGFTSQNLPM